MYAVVFEPFDTEGLEYVRESVNNSWTNKSPVKIFETRVLAQEEAAKWNTAEVVLLSPHEVLHFANPRTNLDEPDFIME